MKYLINKTDGSVAILTLLEDVKVEDEIAKWTDSEQAKVLNWREVSDGDIPVDRTFRNAWSDITEASTVDVDMSKAKEIWKDALRKARKPKLEALDLAVIKAVETDKPVKPIADQKQILRDITALPEIEAAQTPEELKAIWPEVLN